MDDLLFGEPQEETVDSSESPATALTDEQIISLLKGDVDRTRAYQQELSPERERFYRWYRAEPYGNERPGWAQTVHPTIFSAVEWMKPGLIEVFTGDFFTFTPAKNSQVDPDQARESADRLKRYVRHKLYNQSEGEQIVEDFVHDCLTTHYGVLKVTQRDEWDIKTEPNEWIDHQALQADGEIVNVAGGQDVTETDPITGMIVRSGVEGGQVIRKVSKYSGFCLEVVPANELYMLPGYPDLSRNPFVAHVVKRDLDYIYRQEMAGVYEQGSYEACRERGERADSQTQDTSGEAQTRYGVDNLTLPTFDADGEESQSVGNRQVLVWECYVRLKIDETGLMKPCIVTLCGDVVLRRPIENPYEGPPFELGYIYKEPHKAVGRPLASILDQRQRVLSNLLRNIQDGAAMSTYRSFFTTDARTKKALSEASPGDVTLVQSLNAVQEVASTPPPGFVMNAFELTLQEVAKESGVSESMQGLDNNTLNKTAAGMSMRLTAGMQRQKLYARRMARTFKRVLRRILDIIRMFPPQDDQMILGEDVAIAPHDIAGEYSIDIEVGVGPQDKQYNAQQMDGLAQLMIQVGIPMGICEPKQVIKAIRAKFEYLDMDVSEYLHTPEQMDQIQQMGQQLQQTQQELASLQQAVMQHMPGGGQQGSGAPSGIPPQPGPGQPPQQMPPQGAQQ